MSLHRTQELDSKKSYIFGYHPHGFISLGALLNFGTEATGFSKIFPGVSVSLLTLDSNFKIPFYREFLLSLGLGSVSRLSCSNILGQGRSCCIVIGGAEESLFARPGTCDLVLKKRLGFIKIAMKQGASLVPVLGFGENDLYDQLQSKKNSRVYKFQQLMKRILGFTIPMVHARGIFNYDYGILPFRTPVNVVVGKPIPLNQNDNPTADDLLNVQEIYIQELRRIWNEHAAVFQPNRIQELRIVQ